MRKIEKELTDIPATLAIAEQQLTHKRRKELISKGAYIDEPQYNSRYKTPDIKDKLNSLYLHKCAYCEDHAEQTHVDHYRPKKDYYWLAYSWDNLICSCPTCNQFKTDNFAIKGGNVTPPQSTDDLRDINIWSSQKYDKIEKPLLLNPERDDVNSMFSFDKEGHIKGIGDRAKYTIETCHLDRDDLVDQRRRIIDEFCNSVAAELYNASTADDQRRAIEVLIRDFQRKTYDVANTFIAFRHSILERLNDIIKAIVQV